MNSIVYGCADGTRPYIVSIFLLKESEPLENQTNDLSYC